MKLLSKLLLLSVIPFLLIILAISYVNLYLSKAMVRKEIEKSATAELAYRIGCISHFFEQKQAEIQLIAATPIVRKGDLQEILRYLGKEQQRLSEHIEGLYYNDKAGKVHGPSGEVFSVKDRYYFPQIDRGEIVITKVIESRATHRPILLILAPVFNDKGERQGAIGGTILVEDILRMIKDIKLGESGFALMMDEDDRVISGARISDAAQGDSLYQTISPSEAASGLGLLARNMRSSDQGVAHLIYKDSSCLAFFQAMKKMKWALALVYKEDEIYASLAKIKKLNMLICCAVAIALCLFIYGIKRVLLNPIQALEKVLLQLKGGVLTIRADAGSADEIGGLSRSFNEMVDKLNEQTAKLKEEIVDRQTAEDALRKSEMELNAVVRGSPIAQFVIDKDHRIIQWNKALEEATGIRAEEVLRTDRHWRAFYPDQRPCLADLLVDGALDEIPRWYKGGCAESKFLEGAYESEDFFPTLGENGRWLFFTASAIKDSEGNMIGALETLEDITERKQAEEALRESEERFQQVAENAQEWIWEMDAFGLYTYASPIVGKVLGYAPDEIAGKKHFYDLLHPEDRENLKKAAFEAFGQKQVFREFINRNVRKDGKNVWLSTSGVPVLDRQGNLAGYRGADIDITERIQAMEELRKSEQRYRTLFEGAAEGIIAADIATKSFICANPALCKLLGYSEDELKQLTVFDIHPKKDLDYVISEFEAQARGEKTLAPAIPCLRKNGEVLFADIKACRVLIEDKECNIAFFTDTSERRQAEAKLRETEAFLQSIYNGAESPIAVLDITDAGDFVLSGMNAAYERLSGVNRRDGIGKRLEDFVPLLCREPELLALLRQRYQECLQTGETIHYEEKVAASGEEKWWLTHVTPLRNAAGQNYRLIITKANITDRKQSEEERKSHIHFLESLRRIDEAIKRETDVERMLWNVVNTTFELFGCDRAWLLYPCDPDSPSFEVPVLVCRPDYSAGGMLAPAEPLSSAEAQNMREALASDEPVTYIAGTDRPITAAARFGIQSMMIIPLYPKLGKPWVMGMHQCSSPRVWTVEERRLFKEISRRTSDGLSSVLFLRELQENEERFRATFEQAAVGVAHVAPDGQLLRLNQKFCDIVGYSREELLWKTFQDITYPEDLDADLNYVRQVLAGEISTYSMAKRYIRKDSLLVWVNLTVSMVRHASGAPAYFISVIEDISERKKLQRQIEDISRMRESLLGPGDLQSKLKRITDMIVAVFGADFARIWITRPGDLCESGCIHAQAIDGPHVCQTRSRCLHLLASSGRYTHVNGEVHRRVPFGAYKIGRIAAGTDSKFITNNAPNDPRVHNRPWARELGLIAFAGYRLISGEGATIGVLGLFHKQIISSSESALLEEVAATASQVIQESWTEEEREKLREQLLQSQKMESVGRLAGGVAHDFNNMLQAILGNVALSLEDTPADSHVRVSLLEIQKAAQRSANLTRQLLAFARRQTVAPHVLDLNDTVEGMLRMLRRLIGEDIDLAWMPGLDLWPVKIDPSQIDQLLANLCVNARDAISGVGRVTIETDNAVFDEAYCAAHAGFTPGEYILLAISDDGCGMDKETLAHLFEPFFTTKDIGKGTGLGLATVYGIVKQNNGFINVYSEPGGGTAFKIYLPRHAEEDDEEEAHDAAQTIRGGKETVLIVEDEAAILDMAINLLERLGYKVLAAGAPLEALRLAEEFTGEIHLLVSDVIMPKMTGLDLANRLKALRPYLKTLYMSGYTANVIAHRGVLDKGVNFLQKPFAPDSFAAKIRDVLDGK